MLNSFVSARTVALAFHNKICYKPKARLVVLAAWNIHFCRIPVQRHRRRPLSFAVAYHFGTIANVRSCVHTIIEQTHFCLTRPHFVWPMRRQHTFESISRFMEKRITRKIRIQSDRTLARRWLKSMSTRNNQTSVTNLVKVNKFTTKTLICP